MAILKNSLSLSRCLHHTFSKSFFVFLQLGVDSVSASWAGREGWCTFSPRVHLTNKKPRAIFQTLTSPSAWREGWWHRRMMINMVFCWKVKSIFKLKMIINCFERWGEVANLNIYQMKYISSFRLLNISSLTLIYFKEQTYLWWSNRTFTEIFLTMWLPAQITSFKKWPNKILNDERNIVRKVIRYWTMRNIVRKVARKYFCRDASNPSEPAGLNTSDSELEKRVRPRGENPKTFETRNPQ